MGNSISVRNILFFLVLMGGLTFLSMKEKMPKTDDLVIVNTKFGEIHILLFDDTPEHKKNFLKLAREGFYDSTTFHRVIKDFMIQGGDPYTKDDNPYNDGNGGPGYTLPAEIHKHHIHTRGAVAAARKDNPEKRSGGSQFYIIQGKETKREQLKKLTDRYEAAEVSKKFQEMLQQEGNDSLKAKILELQKAHNYQGLQHLVQDSKPLLEKQFGPLTDYSYTEEQLDAYEELGGSPHLDRSYTVFGTVLRGLNVIDSVAVTKVDRRDRPTENIYMTVEVKTMKRKKIQKEYDYLYPGQKKKKKK